ncbi:MAG: hypothetical protein ACE5I3_11275 [Phycisphaerae bacterium]
MALTGVARFRCAGRNAALPREFARMLRADLQAAGIEQDGVAVGSLCTGCGIRSSTGLARPDVAPKLAQDLARHCDINLTLSHCSHTVLGERAAAVEALPDVGDSDKVAAAPRRPAADGLRRRLA